MSTLAEENTIDDYPGLGSASYCLSLLFVAYIFSFIDRSILSLLVGPIREDFGISDFEYSLLQGAAFSLLYAIAGLPLGRLADRYSRKWIVSGAVCFWSLATCACGLTKNFTQLFIARMAVGAGEAGLSPPAYSLILDSFRPQHVGYAMSFYKLGTQVGGGIALIVGGFVIDYWVGIGTISLPLLGDIKPWQATLITVGAPGLLLSLLLLTISEPKRKDLASSDGAILPISTVFRFMWQRKRVYLTLFLGASMMAMAGYGAGAWYPELFSRIHGMSKSEAGVSFGTIVLIAGSFGVMFGAWLASQFDKRGHTDSYVRAIFLTTLIAIPLMVAAPLTGSAEWNLILLWPGMAMAGSFLGVLAVSIVVITPNEMRGQVTAVYLFVTNILGMAIGTTVLAALTDFFFKDDNLLHYSVATVCALFYPLAAVFFWFSMPAYRDAMEEVGKWEI
ncbi:MAG: MFS transporter [Gammaproteobacteria bacterium]|jgi:MFS family permease|nr:MFS transporter [Gammaproteobacteria bacterium]MBT7369871.1 MFS transporter [Gammaproteobacteria bacterium]